MSELHSVSGHIFLVERKLGPRWYAKYRRADGRQVQKMLGPAWTGLGRPAEGFHTRATAEEALRDLLVEAEHALPAAPETAATFADAVAEWLRHAEHEREVRPSTLAEYRSAVSAHLLGAFGERSIGDVTPELVERWRSELVAGGRLSSRTIDKLLTILHGIFERSRAVWGLRANPLDSVERQPVRYSRDFDFLSPEEVEALVSAADSQQDAAVYLTAAHTGLRLGELLELRWRDVDFAGQVVRVWPGEARGPLESSTESRAVPMVPDVAEALAALRWRVDYTHAGDPVFAGATGERLDASALRRRYASALERAGLRRRRFNDLRHTFGRLAASRASVTQVQAWMGHANVSTTLRYFDRPRRPADEVLLLEAALSGGGRDRPGTRSRPTRSQ